MAKIGRGIEEYLAHLSEWIAKVHLVESKFAANANLYDEIDELALCRTLEVVGEICGRMISEHPDWAIGRRGRGLDEAYRLRNKLIHGYESLEVRLLLVIAREDMPKLKLATESWLAELHV